nr:hypothetical protein [uncultured Rhodopila sp.]
MLHAQKNPTSLFHPDHGIAIDKPARQCAAGPIRHRGVAVKYLPPFELIRRSVELSTVRGELHVSISYEDFIKLLKTVFRGVDVDEPWYARTYEDIGAAIEQGVVRSARQHFFDDGYFEGRLPFPIVVDERWYLKQNPDVAESIRTGTVVSAQEHFDKDGYSEGRLPFDL